MVAQGIHATMILFEKIPEILTSPIVLGVGFLMVLALAIGLRPARFTSKAVLNKTERRLFDMLVRVVRDMRPDARVLAQVSYGEFLRSKNKKAFWSINARRADFLIVDAEFAPLAVVEYQGRGHFGSSRRARATGSRLAHVVRLVLSGSRYRNGSPLRKFNSYCNKR